MLRRLRAALEPLTASRKDPFLLDLHASCAGNPHLPYTELYPYIDSIWFGEQCNYAAYSPEQVQLPTQALTHCLICSH